MVRSQLGKIYGKDGPQLAHFPSLPKDLSETSLRTTLVRRTEHLRRIIASLEGLVDATQTPLAEKQIFIGHGRSRLWREVKDFIADRLGLPWEEFNRTAVAGFTTFERLSQMLNNACFAFVIMTAEDEHADAKWHARENVIHEVGLFQGRLGPKRAIVMLENGCQEFSNIHGLSQIRFPSGEVSAAFEEMRRVLEREGILKS
jgi:predicted nucleotide-binding protein